MSKRKSSVDISIIVTAHKEGILAHKTILSLLEGTKKLDAESITYEFIINLDNPDSATKNYFARWEKDPRFIISGVSFGNPADNRNDAVKRASGKYISMIDGDDLVSESWLISAYRMSEKQKHPAVLRPTVHAQFGYDEDNLTLWFMRNSASKEVDAVQMAYWNLWTNLLFAPREILVDTPYRVPKNGFGFEDYLFCCELRSKDIPQLIVPETILWYRRRANSMSSEHIGAVLDYSNLFDVSCMQSIPFDQSATTQAPSLKQKVRSTVVRTYRFAFDTAKRVRPINRIMYPLARNMLYKRKLQKIPDWFENEWKSINAIENQLWPTVGQIAKLEFHPLSFDPYHSHLGQIYQRLCHSMTGDHIDYLFLAPAMSGRGGTEKLIANYIKALINAHPDWKIAILSTQPFNQAALEYFKDIPVDMLDFGRLTQGIVDYEKYIIWSRLLIQSKVKRLHIVNDAYWYHWISRHQKLLTTNNFNVYVSLFMREYVHEDGRVLSFADPDLMQIWTTVTKVFTDNKRVIDDALANNAFDPEKMVVHYQPQDSSELMPVKTVDVTRPIRVLWASRISHQKRPDLLKKIANKLGNDFIVDAYGTIEKCQYKETYFNNSKVNYKGEFNGIKSLPTDEYDVYLYTSQTDGVPNILMEMSTAGLPIIASHVGGISEFIKNDETGVLIENNTAEEFVKALDSVKTDPAKFKKLAKNSQKLMISQHSWKNFFADVKRDI